MDFATPESSPTQVVSAIDLPALQVNGHSPNHFRLSHDLNVTLGS